MNRFACFLLVAATATAIAAGVASPAAAGVHASVTGGNEVSRARYDELWRSIVSIQVAYPSIERLMGPDDLEDVDGGVRSLHTCGGTLVRPDVVVTAAHCVMGDDGDQIVGRSFRVLAGTRTLLDGAKGQPGELVDVRSVRIHPEWREHIGYWDDDEPAPQWDVAVLQLAKPVTLGVPIDMIHADEAAAWGGGVGLRRGAFTAGWGVTNPLYYGIDDDVADDTQAVLHDVAMPLFADRRCESSDSLMGADAAQFDRASMLCAGAPDSNPNLRRSNRHGSCYGDSGGPLIVRAGVDRRPRLVGIVSWGPSFGGGCNAASVYTRVDAVREWVESTIRTFDAGQELLIPPLVSATQVGANSLLVRWGAAGPNTKRYVLRTERSLWSQLSVEDRRELVSRYPRFIRFYKAIRTYSNIALTGPESRSVVARGIPPRRPGTSRYVLLRLEASDTVGRRDTGQVFRALAPVDARPPVRPRAPRIVGRDRGTPNLRWLPVFDNDCVDRYVVELRRVGTDTWRRHDELGADDCPSFDPWEAEDDDAKLTPVPEGWFELTPYRLTAGRYMARIVAIDRAGNRSAGAARPIRIARRIAPPGMTCVTHGETRTCVSRDGSFESSTMTSRAE